jgi:hypothetical protein
LASRFPLDSSSEDDLDPVQELDRKVIDDLARVLSRGAIIRMEDDILE